MIISKRFRTLSFVFLFALLIFSSCKEEELQPSPQVIEINDFIWEHMTNLYLWNEYIPQNIDRSNAFDPSDYFEKLLYKPTDRWSFITDDYEALINSFKGIEKSFGYNLRLFLAPNSNNILGIVKYVVPESPADFAGISRGDMIYKVNGNLLNSDNYYQLLFESESTTLSFGEFDQNGQITATDTKSLTSVLVSENPILKHKTIDYEGNKIGYLMYNQFILEYEDSLASVFTKFQQDGIHDLVLDLRYNPGGYGTTATFLASMIAPANPVLNNDIFSRKIWNDEVNDYFLQEEGEQSNNLVSTFVTPPVNLNLDRIYILITKNSASASELIINCLSPYMEVILIGEDNTTGKYVGSITIHDDESSHNWAMQPITMKSANVDGISDYGDGFAPNYIVEDDFNAPLGTLEEDMLAKAIELITGVTIGEPARIATPKFPANAIPIPNPRMEKKQLLLIEMAK